MAILAACSSAPQRSADRPTLVAADAAMPDATQTSDVNDVTDLTLPEKWKYAAYFNHMKTEVYRVWDPVSVYKQLPTSMTRNLPPTVRNAWRTAA
ncbi:MAG: hypothetical protein ABJE66_22115 [Deltaproteobacteria bacterium]